MYDYNIHVEKIGEAMNLVNSTGEFESEWWLCWNVSLTKALIVHAYER